MQLVLQKQKKTKKKTKAVELFEIYSSFDGNGMWEKNTDKRMEICIDPMRLCFTSHDTIWCGNSHQLSIPPHMVKNTTLTVIGYSDLMIETFNEYKC